MKKFILITFALLSSIATFAYDFMVDGIYYKSLSYEDGTCEVTCVKKDYGLYSGDIVIPTSVTYSEKTYSVTSIGEEAFSFCSNLTSVVIPNSVTTIGEEAFSFCSNLTSVTIPDGVTSIGNYAFYGTALYNNEFNWVSNVLYIGKHLIKANRGITGDYTINDGTITIANDAFYCCTSLTSVTIPNSVTTIGGYAFFNCTGLTSVTIPNSVTSIGYRAFEKCSSLTSVTIPNSVTTIGWLTFSGCSKLTSATIPNSVTTIGEEAFGGCSSLTSVTIPNSVTTIGKYAFYKCI